MLIFCSHEVLYVNTYVQHDVNPYLICEAEISVLIVTPP